MDKQDFIQELMKMDKNEVNNFIREKGKPPKPIRAFIKVLNEANPNEIKNN